MKCIVCNGSGKQTIQTREVTSCTIVKGKGLQITHTNEPTYTTIDCVICQGTGVMTIEQALSYYEQFNMWCDCSNPSGEVTFYDDCQHIGCVQKHHWHCNDCGRITQIG